MSGVSGSRELLNVWVPGRPRTKGSLTPQVDWARQSVRMVETVKESANWRKTVQNEIIRQRYVSDRIGGWMVPAGWPCRGPVTVGCRFYFPREAGEGEDQRYPIARRYGDIDKLLRNVLDALTTVKVYADDSQVVEVLGSKTFRESDAGVRIWVVCALG